MDSRKIILFALVLVVVSLVVGIVVFLGDTPTETDTPSDGNDSAPEETTVESTALSIHDLSLAEETVETGDSLAGEVTVSPTGEGVARETVTFQLMNETGDVLDEETASVETSDERSLTFAGLELPGDMDEGSVTLAATVPSSGDVRRRNAGC